ncbi:hypothetical protein ACOBR2_05190 [Telmatobacter bradus]|uniref:hypothetical protein n=1 Tax=Telmatobacter bradus TaxID=474953 RepID=UPI003B42C9C3
MACENQLLAGHSKCLRGVDILVNNAGIILHGLTTLSDAFVALFDHLTIAKFAY